MGGVRTKHGGFTSHWIVKSEHRGRETQKGKSKAGTETERGALGLKKICAKDLSKKKVPVGGKRDNVLVPGGPGLLGRKGTGKCERRGQKLSR